MFVKICGITSEEDALLAVALGANAVGFVFAPSKRQIAPQIASDIIKRLPSDIISVGVFRDEVAARVDAIAHTAGLHAVQLHGHEPPETAQWLATRVPMVIQAFPAGDARVRRAAEYGASAILLDAPNPGSAQVFDWSLAAEVPPGQRVIVAGGLDAGNVRAAIARTRCWGVDVSSGVERAPGYKDPIKLREFMAEAIAGFEAVESGDPGFGDPRFGDTPFGDTPFGDPRFGDSRFGDTRFGDTAERAEEAGTGGDQEPDLYDWQEDL